MVKIYSFFFSFFFPSSSSIGKVIIFKSFIYIANTSQFLSSAKNIYIFSVEMAKLSVTLLMLFLCQVPMHRSCLQPKSIRYVLQTRKECAYLGLKIDIIQAISISNAILQIDPQFVFLSLLNGCFPKSSRGGFYHILGEPKGNQI